MNPAKDFTFHERGANKFSYCQCNDFWVAVTESFSKGSTFDAAIDWIYLVYGQGKSICQILKLSVGENDKWHNERDDIMELQNMLNGNRIPYVRKIYANLRGIKMHDRIIYCFERAPNSWPHFLFNWLIEHGGAIGGWLGASHLKN